MGGTYPRTWITEGNHWEPHRRLAATGWCSCRISVSPNMPEFILTTKELCSSSPCLPSSCLSFPNGILIPCSQSTVSFSCPSTYHRLLYLLFRPLDWVHGGRDSFLAYCFIPQYPAQCLATYCRFSVNSCWLKRWRKDGWVDEWMIYILFLLPHSELLESSVLAFLFLYHQSVT